VNDWTRLSDVAATTQVLDPRKKARRRDGWVGVRFPMTWGLVARPLATQEPRKLSLWVGIHPPTTPVHLPAAQSSASSRPPALDVGRTSLGHSPRNLPPFKYNLTIQIYNQPLSRARRPFSPPTSNWLQDSCACTSTPHRPVHDLPEDVGLRMRGVDQSI